MTNSSRAGRNSIRRGQVATMTSSFAGLAGGVAVAVVLVYLLIVVNFQSWLDPFIIITALPGALAGILWMLFLTHTTISVPSLTGTIMCMGVATANSILMVSFARERMTEGLNSTEAALDAGYIAHSPGADDGLGHDHRHAAHVSGLGRRWRAERSAGARGDWRADRRHVCHFIFCTMRFFRSAPAAKARHVAERRGRGRSRMTHARWRWEFATSCR